MTDDIYDAMRVVIKALGGMAAVGKRMRPELSIKNAEVWLSDATNRNRAQKLSPEQFMALVQWGREGGCHDLMHFIADDGGYERTKPIRLAEQLALLQSQAQHAQREAEAKAHDLRVLLENPRLFALMQAAHVNTEGMA